MRALDLTRGKKERRRLKENPEEKENIHVPSSKFVPRCIINHSSHRNKNVPMIGIHISYLTRRVLSVR